MTMTTSPNTQRRTRHSATPPVLSVGPAVLLAGTSGNRPVSYPEHRGFAGAPIPRTHAWLCTATREAGLLGRGGAGFPVSAKLAAVGPGAEVLVNGSESDPSSWKDRVLMRSAPHRVIDGVVVVATALSARGATITVHDPVSADALLAACAERRDARDIRVVRSEGGFVSGEVRAAINGLENRPAVPEGRRVLPTERGLLGRPTFASNVETFAALGVLADSGLTGGLPHEAGTTLVTLVGDVPHRGVIEVPHGLRLRDLTGALDGRPVLIGGYHGVWSSAAHLTVDRSALKAAGLAWGAGVVAVLPDDTCALGELARVGQWLARESAGQCGPCVFGLDSLARDLGALHAGALPDVDALKRRAGLISGRGACAHPTGAVRFLGTGLTAYAEEIELHRLGRGCGRPTRGVLPLTSGGAA
ncbi:NADH-ubiquinone oxidoreductase-F iron-sulfur binding region domain-containing protein [Nocardioides sp. Kera G14]|uniref:NADH-ubiquinone oxidoreductase-F iron-sulfur binding region domain-containing protein n=1 Tax=Nocardioides sp. Kera G14 TaxID=2884264 RepID=UPI001D109125|nr:NADH-ubiquinone oxidoreductase-F iron-sulfur binding region domain-containing protein [Nocardioides sp. Kera G14]UDY22350.1 hypothetical protein LH076_09675 [Nocardioides sp. Kera G14]